MATPISIRNFAELAAPGLRGIFQSRLRDREAMGKRTQLFNVAGSQRKFEELLTIGELGIEDWNFSDTKRVQYDSPRKGYKLHVEHKEFAKGMMVERSEIDDNLYGGQSELPTSITGRPAKLADSAFVQRETAAAEVLNYAFTTSGVTPLGFQVVGADGKALCADDHPRGPEDSTTQDNALALTLTAANLQTAMIAHRNFTDDRGNLIAVMPDTLIVPPELGFDAAVIAGTDRIPGSANNDMNVVGGRIKRVVEWDYLTDTNAWFLADGALMAEHLIWFERVPLEFDTDGDFDTLVAKFRAYMRYSRVWADWRWVIGSNPS